MTARSRGGSPASARFGRRWTFGTLGRALAFILAHLVTMFLLARQARASNGQGGANIGGGLLLFAIEAVAAFVWAAVDGRRGVGPAPLGVRWAVVAVVAGAFGPVYNGFSEQPPDLSVILSDLATVSSFVAALIFIPAVIGGGLGLGMRGPAPRLDAHSPATSPPGDDGSDFS